MSTLAPLNLHILRATYVGYLFGEFLYSEFYRVKKLSSALAIARCVTLSLSKRQKLKNHVSASLLAK